MMNKKNVYKLFLFLFMLLAFFISVYPLLWVVIQSLKTETEFLESIWTLPARLNFQNYATAWNDAAHRGKDAARLPLHQTQNRRHRL